MTIDSRLGRLMALWLALGLLAALGCALNPAPPPRSEPPGTYRVGAPDDLVVTVLPDPRIDQTVKVRPDGMISIELIGDVQASGRSIDEIASDIQQRIVRYKRGATVTVQLAAANSTEITILGEVRQNSTFPLVKATRASEAIGMVGGPSSFASRGKIRVIRSDGGETAIYLVNLNAIQRGDLRTDIMLASGDIVYVPPTAWARVGYALNSLLFPFQPLMGVGMSFAGSTLSGR